MPSTRSPTTKSCSSTGGRSDRQLQLHQAAEKNNAENLLVIKDRPDLFAKYYENFQHHLSHSPAYEGHDVAAADGEKEPTKRKKSTSRR